MHFSKTTSVFFFLLLSIISNAQNFELGKVTVAELQEKSHPKDSSAVAAILFKKGESRYEYKKDEGFIKITDVVARIKIYKKEGYDWATEIVSYSIREDSKESVSFSDAVTYNLNGGKIEKTSLKSDGIFDQKVNKYRAEKKITMPNVKEGSVLEFKYSIRSQNIGISRNWDFQTTIPVNFSEYKTFVPEYYVFNTNQKGFLFPVVTAEHKQKSVKFMQMERADPGWSSSNTNTSFYTSSLTYLENKTTYVLENVPALKTEAYVNNIDNYTASLVEELSMTQYPNQPLKKYSTDWKSLVKTIYKFDDFGEELDNTSYFEDDFKALLAGLNSPEEKIMAIFKFVKSNIKWDGYYGFYCNDGVKKAYKNKTGNVAEINLMLTAMLRYAGLQANPVLISTRANGIALFPNLNAFDYVIAAVETTDGIILLDATEKYASPNILPTRDLNWIGRLIRKDETSLEVNLTPTTVSKEIVNMNFGVDKNGIITGKIRNQLSDHEALTFRKRNLLTLKDAYLEELENKNNGIEVGDYVRDNETDLSSPIVESYTFKDTKSFENINNKIYIAPLLFFATKENPFKQEVREYPIDFNYPKQTKFNINIELPEGYVVESLPAPMNVATADDIAAFKYIIANAGNKIQVQATLDLKKVIVAADYYQVIKDFFQQVVTKQNEKIVLVKK
ncbi:transglutaminase domain-containing protein [Flavobacterium restrictum]|uniref:DUF3857 domain-containing protein n=1 Tax=Flavobacterium restrictum TaxID=2594428 RepID=A0A553EBV7_9FLAO|nr:transglutaminase domain-containing protein [Flavobacterium restrictum]TRX42273.1 DUF3857 domain-containing protein [Flavobacterium restrictum]